MADNTLQPSHRNPVYPYHFGYFLAACPLCPVCREAVPARGCIHMADEAFAIWQARRG